ncbi:profilin, required for normal timing of actin polymerization in response to thermal stress [Xylographa trunciseda]|nr:profilin, required for normal timing of actin polymerization in response to thermal stress [Xylographa trunciseda]
MTDIRAYQVKHEELKEITVAYTDPGDVKKVQSAGLHVAGERYVVIKADDRSLYGKQGKTGILIVRTNQALLIAHYPETIQPGTAATTVEQLADYLISVGY